MLLKRFTFGNYFAIILNVKWLWETKEKNKPQPKGNYYG